MFSIWPIAFAISSQFIICQTQIIQNAFCMELLNGGRDPFKMGFFDNVAHGTHSLTIEDIRYFFKVFVPDENNIPTVNLDLNATDIVVPHARRAYPNSGTDKTANYLSKTSCIRAMDHVIMSDSSKFMTTGPSLLEKITHNFHMYEIWIATARDVHTMLANPALAPSDAFCACATNPEDVGAALKRYSVNMKCHVQLREKYLYSIPAAAYYDEAEACSPPDKNDPFYRLREAILPKQLIHKVGTLHEDENLRSMWPTWVAVHTRAMLNPARIRDIANYMYCKLHKNQ